MTTSIPHRVLVPKTNQFIWHIEPAWREILPIERVPELLTSQQIETVKLGLSRSVFHTRLATIDIHIKQCRPVGWRAWMREWLRPAKGSLEFQKLCAVAARRVVTPEPIGWGKTSGFWPGPSFLITRSLSDAVTLGKFLLDVLPTRDEESVFRLRRALAIELGSFLASMHDAGVLHRDLHPGNLLLSFVNSSPRFALLDVHDVSLRGQLSWRERVDNLTTFNRWFSLRTPKSDRLRCWQAYFACVRAQGIGKPEAGELARAIEARTWRSNLGFWRGREGRSMESNRYFQKLLGPGIAGFAVTDLEPASLGSLLADSDLPFQTAGPGILKDSRSSTVADLELQLSGQKQRVIYKRFRVTSAKTGPVSLLRLTPCLRSWRNGHAFRDCLLDSPRPLAVWHRRWHGMNWEGYLLTEKVENCCDLHGFLKSLYACPVHCRDSALRDRVEQVARAVREMHRRGWSHRDLKASNFLVSPAGSQLPGPVWFIDLVGATRPPRLTDTRRQRDLARLNASFWNSPRLSRSDRLRFLRIYLEWAIKGRTNWKSWWRRIAKFTGNKQRQNRRRQRPLA